MTIDQAQAAANLALATAHNAAYVAGNGDTHGATTALYATWDKLLLEQMWINRGSPKATLTADQLAAAYNKLAADANALAQSLGHNADTGDKAHKILMSGPRTKH